MSLAMASQEKPRVKRKRDGGDEKSDADGRHAGDLVEDAQHDNLAGRVVQPAWRTEKVPRDWMQGVIFPLYKEGDNRDPLNYRGSPLFPWSQMSSRHMTDARRAKSMQDELLGRRRRRRRCTQCCIVSTTFDA